MGITIAIDGPAASGKGTVSRGVAKFFGYSYLDTGLIYRAVASLVMSGSDDSTKIADAIEISSNFKLEYLQLKNLRTNEVAVMASKIAVIPEIRKGLTEFQRSFARKNPGSVIDGRDIGTIICPDAKVKLFVTASLQIRAQRRYAELKEMGEVLKFEEILEDLRIRDERDTKRIVAPLQISKDGYLIDTSELSIEASIARAISIVREKA